MSKVELILVGRQQLSSPKILPRRTKARHLKLLIRLTHQDLPAPRTPPSFCRSSPAQFPHDLVIITTTITTTTIPVSSSFAAVPVRIQVIESEAPNLPNDSGAQLGALLANAARENEGVDVAPQRDKVAADEAADAIYE